MGGSTLSYEKLWGGVKKLWRGVFQDSAVAGQPITFSPKNFSRLRRENNTQKKFRAQIYNSFQPRLLPKLVFYVFSTLKYIKFSPAALHLVLVSNTQIPFLCTPSLRQRDTKTRRQMDRERQRQTERQKNRHRGRHRHRYRVTNSQSLKVTDTESQTQSRRHRVADTESRTQEEHFCVVYI